MIASKIIFPTDFSEASNHALRWATSLARDSGAALVIVHVEEPPMAYGGGEMYYPIAEPNRDELHKTLADVHPTDPMVPSVHRLLSGEPADAIVKIAESEGADLIVMGTHGRTGLTRLLMGSVAEAVVRKAPCPVLTVKQPAAVPAGMD
jgi:nucleotide-binding universal stress UspA family protein